MNFPDPEGLRARVAHLLGWTSLVWVESDSSCRRILKGRPPTANILCVTPYFECDQATSEVILDEMRRAGCNVTAIRVGSINPVYACRVVHPDLEGDIQTLQESLPLALCLAANATLGFLKKTID